MKFRKVVILLSMFLLGITTACKKKNGNADDENDNKNPQQKEDENEDVNSSQTVKFKVTFIVDGQYYDFEDVLENKKCNKPADLLKEGYLFKGWYLDDEIFSFDTLIKTNLTLVAKWEKLKEETSVLEEVLPYFKINYGNINGNLNNKGLATFDASSNIHYYSFGNKIYKYNPVTDETTEAHNVETGKATYLNYLNGFIYYLNDNDDFLYEVNLKTNESNKLSDYEMYYLSSNETTLYFIYKNESNVIYGYYNIAKKSFHLEKIYGVEFINVVYNMAIFKALASNEIYFCSYNGMGRTTMIEKDEFIDLDILEMLVLAITNEHKEVSFIVKNSMTEIKLYNSLNAKIETIYQSNNKVSHLNYNGESLFYITDNALWEYNLTLKETNKISDLPNLARNLQIINNWFYFEAGSGDFYRISPLSKEVEQLN